MHWMTSTRASSKPVCKEWKRKRPRPACWDIDPWQRPATQWSIPRPKSTKVSTPHPPSTNKVRAKAQSPSMSNQLHSCILPRLTVVILPISIAMYCCFTLLLQSHVCISILFTTLLSVFISYCVISAFFAEINQKSILLTYTSRCVRETWLANPCHPT